MTCPYAGDGDDPTRDFLVHVQGDHLSVETLVRTWDGDGLDVFLAALAEDFRGWAGERTWKSLEHDLTLSAEHAGHCVRLTWGLHDRLPDNAWHFEATTEHAPGEDMRNLAAEVRAFLQSDPQS
ncbi:hypothetical protein H1D24_24035 [Streptomyces sp. PSKA28]|uniref:Uncharacterized protein n=1 Tax=Streptomyces himalayensis subsp. himalayensis TaxID=2756131 RepID=A0A7W0DPD3_9ACTN|nr:hypothetical protein [Streptomyces himalayensis subsp. himalayensis]